MIYPVCVCNKGLTLTDKLKSNIFFQKSKIASTCKRFVLVDP